MRLIDADALWHNMETADWYNNADRDEVAEPLVLHSPTIGGWISVKDRLPDDASDVLAYYDDGTESRIIPVNYYKGCWYDCVFNRAIDGLETGFIKYWMLLPKAPEVKQNETD